jgi:hypothetical protein
VTGIDGLAGVRDPLPEDLPAAGVERVNRPALLRAIVGCIAVTIEAGLESGVGPRADGAGHIDATAPHDRARMTEAGNRGAPEDVLARLAVPAIGKVLSVRDACGSRPAKRRPASGGAAGTGQRPLPIRRGADEAAFRDRIGHPGGTPDAAIENHAPLPALIGHDVEPHAAVRYTHAIAAGSAAAFGPRRLKLYPALVDLPRTVESGPARANEPEGAIGAEAGVEEAEHQRNGRNDGGLSRARHRCEQAYRQRREQADRCPHQAIYPRYPRHGRVRGIHRGTLVR